MKHLLSILLVVLVLISCQEKKSENTANVKIKVEGLDICEFDVRRGFGDKNPFKVNMENGELLLEIPNVTEPEYILLSSMEEGTHYGIRFFIEKGESSFEGKLVPNEQYPKHKFIKKTKLIASTVNKIDEEWNKKQMDVFKRSNKYFKEYNREEATAYSDKLRAELEEWKLNWVKSHPNSWFSAYQVNTVISGGSDVAMHELLLSYLDPKMDNKQVRSMKAKIKEMKNTDVKLEDLIQAKNVHYKVDQTYKGSDFKNVTYMSAIEGNKLCMLSKAGEFKIVDANGKVESSFQPNSKSPATSFAVSGESEIYALTPNYKIIVKKHRGREIKKQVVDGVACVVFDAKGTEKKRFKFEGLGAASGAKFMNDKLIVSDCKTSRLYIYDAKTGEKKSEIADMRTCCGILDFCIGSDNQLLVADLGAFRVQGYKLNGEKILAFGQRGKELEQFHGCCNPVNIGCLSSGAIVTVEKSPTRIKIYSQDGARLIDGVEELVQGCAYIPMAIDNKDNLYLASPDKGLVKCVSVKS
ncbi:hypothetical protein [Marinifilum sp. D714]|uniref:hypothetical protein n=1 Tax=Marinifilum sp. D714 TaxID=2937523 RepID=UPI0027CE1E16|nr:hypothetical protein [Marinifilum sp. D714]MDQ2177179.1 hypothetical protein [Marinifilum sp. D714]